MDSGIECLRDSYPDGLCPVKDKSPILLYVNNIIVDIYFKARETAETVESSKENKVLTFVKATEVLALFEIYEVDADDYQLYFSRIRLLQNMDNDFRPRFKKAK